MRKTLYLLALLVACAVFQACSGDDNEAASLHDPNDFFEPDSGATDEESLMRRQFRERHGAYLLFNDTLQRKFYGTDLNGDSIYWYELLSVDYTVGQVAYASDHYTYLLLSSTDDKRNAVSFLEDYILNHIGGKLMPYSWFLCRQINYNNGSAVSHPYSVAGQRAVVVSCGMLARLRTEAQKQQYVSRIMSAILGQLLANRQDEFASFFAVSEGYYGLNFNAANDNVARNYVRNRGFLDQRKNTFGSYYVTPSQTEDLGNFSNYALNYSDEYMEAAFKDYPLVLRKWRIFKETMISLGYTF